MSNAYRAVVQSGGGAAVGDATAADVLTGKTFSGAVGSGVAGTMPNNGAVTQTVSAGQSYTIPEGYHNGLGSVTGAGGSYDTSFVPTGANMATAGTNFTVGKSYIIHVGGDSTATLVPTGATVIKAAVSGVTPSTSIYLVTATATTISIGSNGVQSDYAMPVELTI